MNSEINSKIIELARYKIHLKTNRNYLFLQADGRHDTKKYELSIHYNELNQVFRGYFPNAKEIMEYIVENYKSEGIIKFNEGDLIIQKDVRQFTFNLKEEELSREDKLYEELIYPRQEEKKGKEEEKRQLQDKLAKCEHQNQLIKCEKKKRNEDHGQKIEQVRYKFGEDSIQIEVPQTAIIKKQNTRTDFTAGLQGKNVGIEAIKAIVSLEWPQLQHLYLSNNRIGNEGVTELTSIKWLELISLGLANNGITALNWKPNNIPKLERLDLSNISSEPGMPNKITLLPQNLTQFMKLLILAVSGNELREVPSFIKQFPNLKQMTIRIYNNRITSIDRDESIMQLKDGGVKFEGGLKQRT